MGPSIQGRGVLCRMGKQQCCYYVGKITGSNADHMTVNCWRRIDQTSRFKLPQPDVCVTASQLKYKMPPPRQSVTARRQHESMLIFDVLIPNDLELR